MTSPARDAGNTLPLPAPAPLVRREPRAAKDDLGESERAKLERASERFGRQSDATPRNREGGRFASDPPQYDRMDDEAGP